MTATPDKPKYKKGDGNPLWKSAKNAYKFPDLKGGSEQLQEFAVAIGKLNSDLLLHKSKGGFSIHHTDHRRHIISLSGSATTIRIHSRSLDPENDIRCQVDSRGMPTIVIERPEVSNVTDIAEEVLKTKSILITG